MLNIEFLQKLLYNTNMIQEIPQIGQIKILFEEIKNAIPKLPTKYQAVAHKLFIELRPYDKVVIENGLKSSTVATIKKRMIKLLEEKDVLAKQRPNMVLNYNSLEIKVQLAKYAQELDFEAELYPYMSEDNKYVLWNYMLENNESAPEINRKLGKPGTNLKDAKISIFRLIERQIARKREIEEFYEKYDGKDNVDAMAKFLTPIQQTFLDEYILSMDPNAYAQWKQAQGATVSSTRRNIESKFNVFMKRKKECDAFVAKYGKDYLLETFAPTLTENEQYILKNLMMNHLYVSSKDFAKTLGYKSRKTPKYIKQRILERLQALNHEDE